MCAKGLLNGPCGGTRDGRCEVDPEQACAWALIYERLGDQAEFLAESRPPLDHQLSRQPGRVIHPAYKRRFTVDDHEV